MLINKLNLKAILLGCVFSQINFAMEQSENMTVNGITSLIGLGITGGIVKLLSNNPIIDSYANKTGVSNGEAAILAGLSGSLWSLGSTVPSVRPYALLAPVLYASWKIANNSLLNNYVLANIPNVGEHIAGREIYEARSVLRSSDSPFYNMRLLCVLNMIKKHGLDNIHEQDVVTQYDKFSDETKGMMTQNEWNAFFANTDAGKKLCEKYAMFYRKEKPFEIKPHVFDKAVFSAVAVTVCIYEPTKILLQRMFDYPNNIINFSNTFVNKWSIPNWSN